jgi:hypothetical protein
VSEAAIMREIMLALGRRPDVRIWRRNVGLAVPVGRREPVRFGLPGQADLSGIVGPEGWVLEVEVKAPRGRLSDAQRGWGAMIESLGGIWIVARSAEEAVGALDAALAARRNG